MLRISGSGISILHTRQWPSLFQKNSNLQNLSDIRLFHSTVYNPNKRTIETPDLNKKKIKRRRYSFELNQTIARKLDGITSSTSPTFKNLEIQDAIADHAYRRIQIFYYQALAYYQSNCDIYIGKTEIQHGTSNHPWSNAAHSSLLTHLHDNFIEVLQKNLFKEGITEKNTRALKLLGIPKERIKEFLGKTIDESIFEALLSGLEVHRGLIHQNSSLYGTMNATVELPVEVNAYDCILESRMREKAIEILNRVSKEGLHPYQATQILVSEIGAFFQMSLNETREKIQVVKKIETMEHELWIIEAQITTKTVKKYLEALNHVNIEHIRLKSLKEYSIHRKTEFGLGWRANLLMMNKVSDRKIANKVKKHLSAADYCHPQNRMSYIKLLENSLEIANIQWNNTRTPPFKSLSRSFIGGVVHTSTEQDLLDEQLEILGFSLYN